MQVGASNLLNFDLAKPFLRWAGGKTWFLTHIHKFLPKEINNYHEPFLGGASVFFYLLNKKKPRGNIYLTDINTDLINCYKRVQENIDRVIKFLRTYENSSDFYYELRAYKTDDLFEKAAIFIYLNRTSFNGIFRVNREGKYNVPYGHKAYAVLFDFDNLKLVSEALQGVIIRKRDFYRCLNYVSEVDFLFLDPPYTNAHGENGFVKYNEKLFANSEQRKLSKFITKLKEKRAFYVMTNAEHNYIKELFLMVEGKFHSFKRASVIGGKGAKREKINELVFANTQ